ncbi:phytanoyl-CoA dioxygenase family protein [Streptomyces phaeoluteigriseus]|uniref:Phytanoyl-CoA dioxygenase family protein n=1 Tax=Streptomyces phaeoluteigriseus TaxID=114686 RepID=A0ABY4Z9Q6_9ACTN|nr:phytanoyl-CoA dioxygenase family protein [Streptomyces phaeoluteigriseus]USQ85763.1 phytanoyl-CoA dioxygenase family protein [Streptomyces phaeoluteigriseus]
MSTDSEGQSDHLDLVTGDPAYTSNTSNTLTVNCLDQVRIWISSDGLPAKHRARLTRLRAMNGGGRILLIVAGSVLEPDAAREVFEFASRLDIQVRDVSTIPAADADERVILEHIHAEIDAHFFRPEDAKGNLSVVSDYARLLGFVIEQGMCTDMDVEFTHSLCPAAASAPCPLGILARFKDNDCLSNDVTAGFAWSEPFRTARRNVAALVTRYREAAGRFLAAVYGDSVDPSTVSDHPHFFQLRNLRHDPSLTGTARFSLAGGPDNLAIAFHEAGLVCGYERGVERGVEAGELTSDHVPHVLVAGTRSTSLAYEPFEFGAPPSACVRAEQRAQLWPDFLPEVVCHWDHSWIADHHDWQPLTYRERLLLATLDGDEWRRDEAMSIAESRALPRCLVDPPAITAPEPVALQGGPVLSTLAHDQTPARWGVRSTSTGESAGKRHGVSEESLFRDNGIVAVSGLVDDPTLLGLRERFEAEIGKKGETTSLQQLSFNLAVDECARGTIEMIKDLAHLPALTEILDRYFDGRSRFVSARGYRQGPCKPLRYRAWDYHQDMKTKGPFEELKVMVLLTDVTPDGQALRYVCGSQTVEWDFETQRETKFTLDEALQFGNGGLFLGYGTSGTCVVFDTNGIHSGHRNLSRTRDVFTLNFARESAESFFMFSDPILVGPTSCGAAAGHRGRSPSWRTSVEDEDRLTAMCAEYRSTPDLTATKLRWTGDALELVDVMATDLNADLDLRLSARFEDDRGRDIALVKIRDAALDDEQYAEVMSRLHVAGGIRSCLWKNRNPLVAAGEIAEHARGALSSHARGEAAANCSALLSDLCDALGRCDGVQRLRTTAAYLYFTCAWAHRLLVACGGEGLDKGCRQLLDLFAHMVAEDTYTETGEAIRPDA